MKNTLPQLPRLALLLVLVSSFPLSANDDRANDELKRGFAWPIEIGTLDPHNTSSDTIFSLIAHYLAPLVAVSTDNKIVPALAESWEIGPDNQTLILKLRKDATWSDGMPITAQQAKQSLERALSPHSQSDAKHLLLPIKGASQWLNGETYQPLGIKAVNRHQLLIELEGSPINFLRVLAFPIAYPIPLHLMKDGKTYPSIDKLSSSGPYQPTTLRQHFARFKVNQNYFDLPAVFKTVSFRFAPYKELIGDYLNHSLDTLEYVPKDQMTWLNEKMKEHIQLLDNNDISFIVMKHEVLGGFESELRQALMDSLSLKRINEIVNRNYTQIPDGILPWRNSPVNLPNYPSTDIALQQARIILEKQGYNKENPRIACILLQDAPRNRRLFNFLKSHWEQTHIKLKNRKFNSQETLKHKKEELCEVIITGYATRTLSSEEIILNFFPGGLFSPFLHHENAKSIMSREITQVIEPKRRQDIMKRLEYYLLEERHARSLFKSATISLHKPTKLSNYSQAAANFFIPLTYYLKP